MMDKGFGFVMFGVINSVATTEIRGAGDDNLNTWCIKDSMSQLLRPLWSEDVNIIWLNGKYNTWIFSLLASCIVGLSGIVPLFVVSAECGSNLHKGRGAQTLRLFLSFAVGGLLGDVFLHLLPEAWNHLNKAGTDYHTAHLTLGLWILFGIFTFIIIEMVFSISQEKEDTKKLKTNRELSISCGLSNGEVNHYKIINGSVSNGCINTKSKKSIQSQKKLLMIPESKPIEVTGYLNLMANSIDNFTHGLAVSASFVVGTKMGVLTTLAILMHEIPHEIGDFAILLRSGFNRWDAAKAQISTAGIGILGAIVALSVDSTDALGNCTAWILPFTSGGFLNIALVNVLPEIIKDDNPWESLKQIGCLCSGIAVMALVTLVTE